MTALVTRPEQQNQNLEINLSGVLVSALGDMDNLKIIQSIMDKAKTISEILTETNIPQTSGYRKIKALEKKGMIIKDGIRDKVDLYRSIGEKINISFGKNSLDVQIKPELITQDHKWFKQ